MILSRLLAGCIVPAVLIGCASFKDIDDIKADIRELKIKAGGRLLQYQQPCPSPGTSTNVECSYRLTITSLDKATKKAMGRIPKSVIGDAQKDCTKDHDDRVIDPRFVCPDADDYEYHEYVFEIDDPSKIEAKGTYNFLNIPKSHRLTLDQDQES